VSNFRIIARLDVKGDNLIKGIHLEGLRVLGRPEDFARKYYEQGVDEIVYMDAVASLYGRNSLKAVIERTACEVFVPMTVGGGIRSVNDAATLLRAGADKVALNTAAVENPSILTDIALRFGAQAVVLSVEAKKNHQTGRWEVYTSNGRDRTGLDVVEWSRRAVELGAGEILLTSVDREGTRKGFDVDMVAAVSSAVDVSVVASGGFGNPQHLFELTTRSHVSGVAIADCFHYGRTNIGDLKQVALDKGLKVRRT
jgi:cyclase